MHSVHKFKRKKNRYIYIIVIGVALLILNPFNIIGTLRSFGAIAFVPFGNFGSGIGSSAKDAFSIVLHMSDMNQQNQLLSQEVQQLRAQIAMFSDVQNENDVLRSELQLLPRNNFDLVYAEAIARDVLGGDQWIMINKGSNDGITNDMAVIVQDSIFVGYIDSVDQSVSRVRLLTHPESVINVVDSRSGAEAIARGYHGLSLVVEDIKKEDQVENGDVFVTSQIGNRFPRGLSVGTAQNVSLTEDDLFQSAIITPIVPLDSFRFVAVIKK